jgi:hypothetical protein
MIRLGNNAVACPVIGCSVDKEGFIICLDLAPAHQTVHEALWADMVCNTGRKLTLFDDSSSEGVIMVKGMGHAYMRLSEPVPELTTGRSRTKVTRLLAKEAVQEVIESTEKPFYVLGWPDMSCGQALAAILEHKSRWPIEAGWGDYLLETCIKKQLASPLTTYGTGKEGYRIDAAPWAEIIGEGIEKENIAV